ncbi:hypothetical protein [uncultured Treponema sp.]|nr:hypothetical protein [uncultured Treponema sp.]
MLKTFLEQYQSSDTTITILEWMNRFKSDMKIQHIIKSDFRFCIVFH